MAKRREEVFFKGRNFQENKVLNDGWVKYGYVVELVDHDQRSGTADRVNVVKSQRLFPKNKEGSCLPYS